MPVNHLTLPEGYGHVSQIQTCFWQKTGCCHSGCSTISQSFYFLLKNQVLLLHEGRKREKMQTTCQKRQPRYWKHLLKYVPPQNVMVLILEWSAAYQSINHPEKLKLSIMHFICFNCLATAYVDTHVHYHSYLLLSIPIWYLVVKEKLQKYKVSHAIHNCGRKRGQEKSCCWAVPSFQMFILNLQMFSLHLLLLYNK